MGLQRMIVVSVIGIDKFSGGYATAKIAHENAMLSGPIPTRIVRAAQFYVLVPRVSSGPVSADMRSWLWHKW
jgi:hypothetical protein